MDETTDWNRKFRGLLPDDVQQKRREQIEETGKTNYRCRMEVQEYPFVGGFLGKTNKNHVLSYISLRYWDEC